MNDSDAGGLQGAGQSAYETLVDVVLTGIVVILPIVVTLYVLSVAVGILTSAIAPFIGLLQAVGVLGDLEQFTVGRILVRVGLAGSVEAFLAELVAIGLLVVIILAVGVIARMQYGDRLIDYFDHLLASVPGIGTIYESFRRMGDVVLDSGVENFQSVKLVEFPQDGVYVLGFETATSPLAIQETAGFDGMTTLFLPLAPNPVMGGFLTHIPDERVLPVDMTVQEATRTIITSGIAADSPEDEEYRDLSEEERSRITRLDAGDETGAGDEGADD